MGNLTSYQRANSSKIRTTHNNLISGNNTLDYSFLTRRHTGMRPELIKNLERKVNLGCFVNLTTIENSYPGVKDAIWYPGVRDSLVPDEPLAPLGDNRNEMIVH